MKIKLTFALCFCCLGSGLPSQNMSAVEDSANQTSQAGLLHKRAAINAGAEQQPPAPRSSHSHQAKPSLRHSRAQD